MNKIIKMPRFAPSLLLALALWSCKEVSFREPQPAGVPELKSVPNALQGKYRAVNENGPENDADTLIIESWGYHFKDAKDNDWLGKGTISDSLIVKYYGDMYFVNFRSGDQWVLRLIRQKPGAIEFLSINISEDAKRKEILKKLQKKFKVKEFERKDDVYYQINPTRDQLMQLIREGYFTGPELTRIP